MILSEENSENDSKNPSGELSGHQSVSDSGKVNEKQMISNTRETDKLSVSSKFRQKKIALINDIAGYGRCAISVQLPVISALKVQCCPLPTSIFSNNTAFNEYYMEDFTQNMLPYMEAWEKNGFRFDGICTGFLGSPGQVQVIETFFKKFKTANTVVVVDPIMGDNGKLYAASTEEMCSKLRALVGYADICTPNLTEACVLTGTAYKEKWSSKEIAGLAEKLLRLGPEKVVITGIVQGSYIANYCCERTGKYGGTGDKGSKIVGEYSRTGDKGGKIVGEYGITGGYVRCKKAGTQRCGTGDVFTAIVAAEAVKGTDFKEAVKKASVFVKRCIERSVELDIPLTDGVCFEEILTELR